MPATLNGSGHRRSLFWRVYDWIAEAADRRIGWDRLPVPLGLLTLVGVRNVLRRRNLYDTRTEPTVDPPRARPRWPPATSRRPMPMNDPAGDPPATSEPNGLPTPQLIAPVSSGEPVAWIGLA